MKVRRTDRRNRLRSRMALARKVQRQAVVALIARQTFSYANFIGCQSMSESQQSSRMKEWLSSIDFIPLRNRNSRQLSGRPSGERLATVQLRKKDKQDQLNRTRWVEAFRARQAGLIPYQIYFPPVPKPPHEACDAATSSATPAIPRGQG